MNANGDLGRRLSGHYASEAPHRAPDWVLESALNAIDVTPQRRVLIRVPWRFPIMNTYAKLGVAAVVAVVLVGGGIAILNSGASSGPGGTPSVAPSPAPSTAPSPSPAPSPNPSPINTADWVPFTSARYGYQISYPASHTGTTGSTTSDTTEVIPAQRDFSIGTDRITVSADDVANDWFILGPDGSQIGVFGFAGTVPNGMSVDELIDASFASCPSGRSSEAVTIDGQPGRLDVGCEVSIAVVVVGDRAYVFGEGHGLYQDLLKAFLSTVQLPTS